MPAPELRIGNRTAYFRKAIRTPEFSSERVLARDAFQFGQLWLERECPKATPYWEQAHHYFEASRNLPPQSAPLTSYYCFLNAAKALLTVKGVPFAESHGVAGLIAATARRSFRNEQITLQNAGILATLSNYLEEEENTHTHTLSDILSNLPFIHRAYRFTFRSHPELFIPVRNVIYRKHPEQDYIWVTANIDGRFADGRRLKTLPQQFERDDGYINECVIRTKRRVEWYHKTSSKSDKMRALNRFRTYHRKLRQHLVYISSLPDLWYLKRSIAGATCISRFSMTLIMAAMHRLSELSRYDPRGLRTYLEGKENWLLTEFIELSPRQFIDELVCEMTSLEFGLPGIRPRGI